MAAFSHLPLEVLSNTAADSSLTNRDRKQARLACRKLAGAMTPFIFRRAYISRIKTDRDAFLSLAATPHLAVHVEEIIWFELEIDWRCFKEENKLEVQLSDDRNVNLFLAARDLFWLPPEPKPQHDRDENNNIVYPDPPECAAEFLVQFKAAVALMPKLHTLASEQMAPFRIVSLADGFPFEVGLLTKDNYHGQAWAWSDFLHIFLETIAEEKGRINKLRCGNELSGSLARIDPRYHAAMPYLTSLELSIADVHTTIGSPEVMADLRDALYKATELRELSVSLDCNSEFTRMVMPRTRGYIDILLQQHHQVHIWRHLRSLKLGAFNERAHILLLLIEVHAPTLRHLHLDQCRPPRSVVRGLSQIDGLQLDSITISNSEYQKSDLVSEEALLRFIRGQDVGDLQEAEKIGKGMFFTANRRTDNFDIEVAEDPEADLDALSDPDDPIGPDDFSDHSSESWSDVEAKSESGSDPDSDS